MKIAYIIDLDGTLYDNSHRQHLIPADRNNTAGWVPFNAACEKDILRKEVANLVRAVATEGGDVIFLTARGEDAREPTFNRLHHDFSFAYSSDLIMRQMNDHRSAAEFKSSFISGLKSEFSVYRDHTLVAIEDDPAVVDAMRALGVTVLHIDSKCCTVKKPHHNGMMQLSNELADAKAALRRLSMYARTVAGDIQYTGDHPIAVAEKLAGRQWFGNTEQLDTAPAQFESLAGEPVSQPYKLPEHVQKELQTACLCFLLGATGNKNRDNYFYDQSTDFHVCLHQVAEGMGLVKCVGNYSWVLDKEITKQIDAIYEKYAKLMMGAAMEVEQ